MFRFFITCFLLTSTTIYSQKLHHQMISSQGNKSKLESGYYITQTIGQQSIIGTSSSNKSMIIQGFQQGAWAKLIEGSILPKQQNVTVYPNPFIETVVFDFSEPVYGDMQIAIFDVSGRLVAERFQTNSGNGLRLQLNFLSNGIYLVQLRHKELKYYTKIIKKSE
tara:strand:+ start:441 stop:935 length:495 start_codon:yes stop_codon:yes gene_type:complete